MHYDFKRKLNKIDSQQNRNLQIPEIDWVLNEAQSLYVDMIAQPRLRKHLGFELSQKNIDDIRTVVVPNYCGGNLQQLSSTLFQYTLPSDYRYFLKGDALMYKEGCEREGVSARILVRRHDDEFEESPFDKSSYQWRTANAIFVGDNYIHLFSDGTFTYTQVCINYIKHPKRIHNAADFGTGSYKLPDGIVLTGAVNCELPIHTHSEIVDLAVLISTGDLQIPDYQIKAEKIKLNNLI